MAATHWIYVDKPLQKDFTQCTPVLHRKRARNCLSILSLFLEMKRFISYRIVNVPEIVVWHIVESYYVR